jgi:hypothetical protein
MRALVGRVNPFADPGAQASRRAGAFIRSRRKLPIDQMAEKSNQLAPFACAGLCCAAGLLRCIERKHVPGSGSVIVTGPE